MSPLLFDLTIQHAKKKLDFTVPVCSWRSAVSKSEAVGLSGDDMTTMIKRLGEDEQSRWKMNVVVNFLLFKLRCCLVCSEMCWKVYFLKDDLLVCLFDSFLLPRISIGSPAGSKLIDKTVRFLSSPSTSFHFAKPMPIITFAQSGRSQLKREKLFFSTRRLPLVIEVFSFWIQIIERDQSLLSTVATRSVGGSPKLSDFQRGSVKVLSQIAMILRLATANVVKLMVIGRSMVALQPHTIALLAH